MTDGFRNRVATNVVPMQQRDSAAFRSGVAEGLGALGQVAGRIADQDHDQRQRLAQLEYQQRSQEEHLSLSRELADARLAFSKRQMEAEAAPPETVDGFTAKVGEDWGTAAQAIVGKATSRDAQTSLLEQSAAIGAGLEQQAQRFEIGTRVRRQTDDIKRAGDAFENQALDLGRGQDVAAKLAYTQLAAYGEGLAKTAGPEIARRFVRDTGIAMQRRQAEGAITRGEFDFVRTMIDGADAKASWDPDVRQALTVKLISAERVAAAQQRAEAAAALTEIRQANSTRQAELDTGAGQPQDWFDLAKNQEAAQDADAAVRSRAKGNEMLAALSSRGEPLPVLDAAIATLDNKAAAGGGLSPAEAAQRAGLQTERRQQAALLGQAGGAVLALARATNKVVQPIDWSDPQSIAARATMARTASATYNKPLEPLTQADIDGLRDGMSNGPGGKRQVLMQIAGLRDPVAVVAAARQLSGPGDGAFTMAARVLSYPAGQTLAREILSGEEIRKKSAWPDGQLARARSDFASWYGGVLRHLPPDYRNDLVEGALNFYAARSNGGGYDAGLFAEAIETVLGKSGAGGGLARTPRGNVVAPPTMKPVDMMTRFARASGDDYQAASGGRAPRGADGQPFTRGEFRALLPTLLNDGRYGFRGSNGELVHDDRGGVYAVDLWKLPGR